MDDDDDHMFPPIDPAIRSDYADAIGRLILAHSEVDYEMAYLLQRLGDRFDIAVLRKPPQTFSGRADLLELCVRLQPASTKPRLLTGFDFGLLRQANTVRNAVAHAYFDQNPYDGSYRLERFGRRHIVYSPATLGDFTVILDRMAAILRTHSAFFDFTDLTATD